MNIRCAVCYSSDVNHESALAYLRLIGPLSQSGISIVNGIVNNQIKVDLVSKADIVVIQRDFPRQFCAYEKIIELAHKDNKPILFDLDDNLFFLPETHPNRQSAEYGPSLLPMFQALIQADLVTVSTPKLRDIVSKYNEKVLVFPNYFNDSLWHLTSPVLKHSSQAKLIIGYMGTHTHKPDLEYISPALLDLIGRYPQKLLFKFWGAQPPGELESLPQVKWVPFDSISYKSFVEFFQTQSADIFIAPLIDNLFNRCKSPLKFFEYSALGAPGVFSRLDPYENIIAHGEDGFLSSSLEEWIDCLSELVENDELRLQLATNAQAKIRDSWLLSQSKFPWEEAFQSFIKISFLKRDQNNDLLKIVQTINKQLYETFSLFDFSLKEVHRLRHEVRAYTQSKSWKVTQPLRVIEDFLRRFIS